MKGSVVFLWALCTATMVFAGNAHRSSNVNSNENDLDYDQQYRSQQSRTSQKHTHQGSNSDETLWSELTDVMPYRLKITQRIENSEALRDQPETKEKLMNFMEDKLQVCKTLSAAKHQVDRQCAGRLTGQMMQMIGRFEKESRQNMPSLIVW